MKLGCCDLTPHPHPPQDGRDPSSDVGARRLDGHPRRSKQPLVSQNAKYLRPLTPPYEGPTPPYEGP